MKKKHIKLIKNLAVAIPQYVVPIGKTIIVNGAKANYRVPSHLRVLKKIYVNSGIEAVKKEVDRRIWHANEFAKKYPDLKSKLLPSQTLYFITVPGDNQVPEQDEVTQKGESLAQTSF